MPTLRDIRLFVAVYEERSFTVAAQREGATQPGVSQHIRRLEDRFRVPLFIRENGVVPTPAADVFYRSCIDVLRAQGYAVRELSQFGHGLTGEITLGLMPALTRSLLAPALAAYAQENPNVAVQLVEGFSGLLTQQVRSGELECAIVPAFGGVVGLKMAPFLKSEEVLLSRRGSGLPHLERIRLRDAGQLNYIVPAAKNTTRHNLETYLASNGVSVGRVMGLDSIFGMLDLVAQAGWVCFLPAIMLQPELDAITYEITLLDDPAPSVDLVLIEPARRSLSSELQAFVAKLAEEGNRANASWLERLEAATRGRPERPPATAARFSRPSDPHQPAEPGP